jgi:hypothetical protein
MAVANTLAYFDKATIAVVKSFIIEALGELFVLFSKNVENLDQPGRP